MRVYVIHLEGPAALARALRPRARIRCSQLHDRARARTHPLLAPADIADALVERIYQEGGLLWCSRHDVEAPKADDVDLENVTEPAHPA